MSEDDLGAEVGEAVGERVAGEKGKRVGRIVGAGIETMIKETVDSENKK